MAKKIRLSPKIILITAKKLPDLHKEATGSKSVLLVVIRM